MGRRRETKAMPERATVGSTGRLYASAQAAFAEWCNRQGMSNPGHEDIARYLAECATTRGPSAAPVHLSAIADLFRSEGRYLDTRSPLIQAAMEPIRRSMKRARHG